MEHDVQLPSHVLLFVIPWTATHQTFLPLTISQNLPKFMFIASVTLSSHLILWCLLLLLPSMFCSIRDFSNESSASIRCPKYWSFSFSIGPSMEYSGLISFKIDWFDLFAVQKFSPAPQFEASSLWNSVFFTELIKLKNFSTTKEIINKKKRQPSKWWKIFANEATIKEHSSKIYKQFMLLNNKKING